MGVQAFLEEHQVFSLRAFRAELGEGHSAYNLLMRAVRAGQAERVVQGVYVSRSGRFSSLEPDPFRVAAELAEDVTVVYHSALEVHGLAHSPWRRVQFTTSTNFSTFSYRGFSYERYSLPKALRESGAVHFTTLTRRTEGMVRTSTRERTLVDAVNRSDLCGGLEEVFRSLASLPFVDSSNVVAYLKALRAPTAVARVGWVLEQRARDWFVSEDDLTTMRKMLGAGPYYLTRNNEPGRWVSGWRLYVPEDPPHLERWLNE
jgi:predicted transcriptional regulator of viral defense system